MMQKRLVAAAIARMLRSENRTIIYVTHYEAEIPPEITRVFRLSRR